MRGSLEKYLTMNGGLQATPQFRLTSQTRSSLAFIVYFLFYDKNSDIMSSTRAVESNTFGDNARIHQGDVIHNYASNPTAPMPRLNRPNVSDCWGPTYLQGACVFVYL